AILNLIAINPGLSQNDLAGAVVIKKSAVTKIVKELEARGFVSRRKTSADKRYNAITLTTAGQEKLAGVRARMEEQQRGILSPFTPEAQEQLFALLDRRLAHRVPRSGAAALASGMGEANDQTPA